MPDITDLNAALARGVELVPVQVWRDAETQNVIIQIAPGHTQAVFSADQWLRTVEFLDPEKNTETVVYPQEPPGPL